MPGYPIELDLRGRRVLVVGLGRVGTRKASGLVEAGAYVVGVDPRPDVAIPGVEHRPEEFRPEHFEGMSLAFAAATPGVNREVVEFAKRLGIWVNAASDPERGDFLVPATWRSGLVTLAVSTSGASPALAATLRDRAAEAMRGRARPGRLAGRVPGPCADGEGRRARGPPPAALGLGRRPLARRDRAATAPRPSGRLAGEPGRDRAAAGASGESPPV